MGPGHHLKGEEEGEESEDGNLSSEMRKAALPRPSVIDTIEDTLVNNMKELKIEREAVKKDTEDEDEECLLKTLTIGVSLQDRRLQSKSSTVIWSYSIAGNF